jgi:hypothetical protein
MDKAVFVNRPTFAADGHALSRRVPLALSGESAACKQPDLLLAGDIGRALAVTPQSPDQAGQGLTTCDPPSEAHPQSVALVLLSPVEKSDLANAPIHQSHDRH